MALQEYTPVPVLHPTLEEFLNFSAYIERHLANFEKVGLMKIIPPSGWNTNLPTEATADGIQITRPIQQVIEGTKGLYQAMNIERKTIPIEEFKKMAEAQAKDLQGKGSTKEEYTWVERRFWKNVTRFPATYGADVLGSLFEKTGSAWNLRKINSILDLLPRKLPGINEAYLYFGMWKAMFAWHTEDMELYSVNYVHFGKPKAWYALKPQDKLRFDRVAAASECSQFLRHKTSIISPAVLHADGIEVAHVVQEPGEFIVTFPSSYHCGFNHGFNCAESVNFALPSWLEYGKRAKVCRCRDDTVRFDMLELEQRWLQVTGQVPSKELAPTISYVFSCRCGVEWKGTNKDPAQPIGHLFECSGCRTWSHVDCYGRYAKKDPVDLPAAMYCHTCRPAGPGKRQDGDTTSSSALPAQRKKPRKPAPASPAAVSVKKEPEEQTSAAPAPLPPPRSGTPLSSPLQASEIPPAVPLAVPPPLAPHPSPQPTYPSSDPLVAPPPLGWHAHHYLQPYPLVLAPYQGSPLSFSPPVAPPALPLPFDNEHPRV